MPFGEGQRLGALAVLAAALFFYGASLWTAQRPNPAPSLPWGDQRPDSLVASFTGFGRADGVYFIPPEKAGARDAAGIDLRGLPDRGAFASSFAGRAVSIAREGERRIVADLPAANRLALGLPVNPNRVSAEDLTLVPGIGAKLAAGIVERRRKSGEFRDLDELAEVPGLGEGRLALLRKFLTLSPDH